MLCRRQPSNKLQQHGNVEEQLKSVTKNPIALQQVYQGLCCSADSGEYRQVQQQLPVISSIEYLQALRAGAQIQAMSVQAKTQERRDKAMEELGAWLRQNQPNRGLRACLPEDIIVYLVSWWSQEHGGCIAPDGSRYAAPGGVESLCSHLAVEFDKLGRCGEYCPASMGGNPVRSVQLQRFRQGYAKFAVEQGYQQTSARPWQECEVVGVLQHISRQLLQARGIQAVLLARDAFLFSVLWQSKSRGVNAGAWRVENVKLTSGAPGILQVYPVLLLPSGSKIALQPDSIKNGDRKPLEVAIRHDILCSMTWLSILLKKSATYGQPVVNFLTRPQSRDKKGFIERAMTSSEIANRTKERLQAAQLYCGHTVHGSRRGSMQHDRYLLNKSVEEIGAAAGIKTAAIVHRYLDKFRHCN